jgi:hypothetical protein
MYIHVSGSSENEKYLRQICTKNKNIHFFSDYFTKNRAIYKKCGVEIQNALQCFHLQHQLRERATILRVFLKT